MIEQIQQALAGVRRPTSDDVERLARYDENVARLNTQLETLAGELAESHRIYGAPTAPTRSTLLRLLEDAEAELPDPEPEAVPSSSRAPRRRKVVQSDLPPEEDAP
jgi:hypothetical protein